MSKSNGKADIRVEDKRQRADLEHELPPADPADGFQEKAGGSEERIAGATPQEDEIKKLRDERDGLFDRLPSLQAESHNYRKHAANENADIREDPLAHASHSLL